ncbi:hypothetical protein APHAL10511_005670 [Amanita phalloides]|nr:hypothetical protein APHAL10511_005670 [Amanita phalloides]
MRAILKLPTLADGTAQGRLAGLLPLSPLIDFTDVVKMLHFYELSGCNIAWNWPITPVGARLLLNRCTSDENEACLLDGSGRSPSLQCIDMRWGDHYTCANGYTVRNCIKHALPAPSNFVPEKAETVFRPQKLNVVRIFHGRSLAGDPDAENGYVRTYPTGLKVFVIQVGGWVVWLAAVVFSILCACPIAFAYIALLAVTGLFVRTIFGHLPRLLSARNSKDDSWRRAVVVTEHMNETEWTIFIGDSKLVDSLLNKPLLPTKPNGLRKVATLEGVSLLRLLLKLIIATQWGLLIAASVLQNWDAILIAVALMFCACVTTFVFRPEVSLESWLRSNEVGLEKLTVTFSGRRAMLSAMVAINPDSEPTGWIDPILKTSGDRSPWERALKEWMWEGIEPKGPMWWTAAIKEGAQKAASVNGWLLQSEVANREPKRRPEQMPFNLTKLASDYYDPVVLESKAALLKRQDHKSRGPSFMSIIRNLFPVHRSQWERRMKDDVLHIDPQIDAKMDIASPMTLVHEKCDKPDLNRSLPGTPSIVTQNANAPLTPSPAETISTSSLLSRNELDLDGTIRRSSPL